MSNPSRRLRRAQERQMVKGLRAAVRQQAPPEPSPADRAAERLQALGVQVERSMLLVPQGRQR